MNTELKLQALLDGALDAREVRDIESLLARDAQSAALMQELKWMKTAIAGNETEMKLPETREFYWSKIERGITTEAVKAAATPTERAWWFKFLYPATGLIAMVAVMFAISGGRATDGADTESVPEDVNAISFRSETEALSVVYVADEDATFSPASHEAKNEPEADK